MLLDLAGIPVPGSLVPRTRIDRLNAVRRLYAVALNVLVGLDCFVRLDMRGVARLDALDIFVALDSLHALCALAELRAGLRPAQGLDALQISRADAAELPLKARVLELRVAMRRVEPPRLRGAGSDGDPVKSAVEDGIGLDRAEAWMSPVVTVPQRRADKGGRAERDHGTGHPPARAPEERRVGRRPIAGAVDDDRIVDRHVDIVRLQRLDDVVFRRPRITRALRRRNATDLLLLA